MTETAWSAGGPHAAAPPFTWRRLSPLAPSRPVRSLLVLAATLYMLVSESVLTWLGIPYSEEGGSLLAKLHPGTYLALLALLLHLVGGGNPVERLIRMIQGAPVFGVLAGTTVAVSLYFFVRYGLSGVAALIDTFLAPAAIGLILSTASPGFRRSLFLWVFTLVVLNDLVAIAEAVTRTHVVPFTISGRAVIEATFRPAAFLGHPLNVAAVTTLFMLSLMGLPMGSSRKWWLVLLMVVSLVAIGGRTGLVVAMLSLALWALGAVVLAIMRGSLSYAAWLAGFVAVVAALGASAGLVATLGVGERIFSTFYFDSSAEARVTMFQVFEYFDGMDLAFGVSTEEILDISRRLGLVAPYSDIENYVIKLVMNLGLVGATPLLIAIVVLFRWAFAVMPGASKLAVGALFVICLSNNSLATKDRILSLLVAASFGAQAYAQIRTVRTARVPV